MTSIIAVLGCMLLLTVLWDAFEAIILPRRVTRYLGLARVFLRFTWRLRSAVAHWIRDDRRREAYLSIIGPLSLFLLLGMWAAGLVAGFAMLHWGLGTPLNVAPGSVPFSTYLYLSGTTFFTLGLGDVTPLATAGTGAGGGRSRDRFWLPDGRHLVPAHPLSSVFAPRGEHFAPRRPGGVTSQCRGALTAARTGYARARPLAL